MSFDFKNRRKNKNLYNNNVCWYASFSSGFYELTVLQIVHAVLIRYNLFPGKSRDNRELLSFELDFHSKVTWKGVIHPQSVFTQSWKRINGPLCLIAFPISCLCAFIFVPISISHMHVNMHPVVFAGNCMHKNLWFFWTIRFPFFPIHPSKLRVDASCWSCFASFPYRRF